MELATILLLIYLAVALGIGAISRSGQTDDDFVIGSRNVKSFGLTASIFATMMTESLVFFYVGLAARFGPIGATGAALGPSLALLVLSFFAKRAHGTAAEKRFVCVSDYCRTAWGPVAGRLAKLTIVSMLLWVVILQINLNGALLGGLLGWSQLLSTFVAVSIVVVYLTLGGYRAVIKTDVFQAFLLLSILMVPLFVTHRPSTAVFESSPGVGLDAVLLCFTSFALTIVRPEMWQRIYSASSGRVAARAMRTAALLFLVVCGFILYYAFAVAEAMPGANPVEAFVGGYREVLTPTAAAFFPVLLLAAMMSSLDSAAFLFSINIVRLRPRWAEEPRRWGRIVMLISLLVAGGASLYIFKALTFAYKINGIIMLFTAPLLISMRRRIDTSLLIPALAVGLLVYVFQIVTGRIDANPSESIAGGVATGLVLVIGLAVQARSSRTVVS